MGLHLLKILSLHLLLSLHLSGSLPTPECAVARCGACRLWCSGRLTCGASSCYWSYWSFNEQSTAATHVACPVG